MSTLVGPGQSLTIFAILVLAAAAGIVGEAKGWYGKVSGVFITILGCAFLVTFNVMPSASDQQIEVPVYQFVFTYFVPFSIPPLLFNAQIKKIWREAGRLTILFLLGTVGVILGAIIAYLVINLGPETSKVASVFIGTYTGGSVNFMSVAAALDFVRSPLFAACVAVDNVYTNVYFLLIFTIPVWSIIRRFYPYYSEEEKELADHPTVPITGFKIEDLAQVLLITASIVAIGAGLNGPLQQLLHTSIQMDIVVITVLTLVLVNAFPAFFSKLEPSAFPIGVWLMFVFIAAIGAASDIKAILHSSPAIIGFVSIILIVNFIFILLAGYWLKFSLKEIAIASIANIGGPSVSAPMAANYGMKMAVTPAILIAILGYVIGTILGIGFGAITG